MDAIGDDGSIRLDQTCHASDVGQGYTFFAEGDVIIAKITPCFENGKGALARGLRNGVAFGTTELIVVRPKHGCSWGPYLQWLFTSPDFRLQATAAMYGAGGQKRVPDDSVRDFAVALPSMGEQQAIAAFLDRETAKIDALVSEQEHLLGLLSEKRQALIFQAVTQGLEPSVPMKNSGVEWLGQTPVDWTICALNYKYEIELGKMLDGAKIAGSHLEPYLRNVDVQWWHINADDLPKMDFIGDDVGRFILKKGDLLVCEGGEVGRGAIWNAPLERCFYQKALHRVRARNASEDMPEFLLYALFAVASTGTLAENGGRTTIAHLPAEVFRRQRFAFPPIEEQRAIVEFLDEETRRINVITEECNKAISLIGERRAALISAAVTGKVDVRGFVPARQEAA